MMQLSLKSVQRFHGGFLVVLSLGLAVGSVYMERTGKGVYGFLHENPMGEAGLIQAYLLMTVIGLSILIGSSAQPARKVWDIIGILAHLPPLIALVLYGYLFLELNLAYVIGVSIAIHATWIVIETCALICLNTKQIGER